MMQRWWPWLLLAFIGLGLSFTDARLPGLSPSSPAPPAAPQGTAPDSSATQRLAGAGPTQPELLPPEARHTIALIRADGPFPHRQDGAVFGNREGRLPRQARGWYREYTVDTPGLGHRGARRIVTGGAPPVRWYYTDDHYDSFVRFDPAGHGP